MYLIFLYKQKTVYGWILTKTQFCAPIWTAAAWVSSFMHYSLKWLEKFYCFPSPHLFVFHPSLNLFIQMPHMYTLSKITQKMCSIFSDKYFVATVLFLPQKCNFTFFWKRNFYRRKGIFSKGDNHKWCLLFENWWCIRL